MKRQFTEVISDAARRADFSGVVRVTVDGQVITELARGEADRQERIANTAATRFGIASGTKLLTALAAGALIDEGRIALGDRLVDLVDRPLPNVAPEVTIDHLLTHTSGVYDYYDEELVDDFDSFELEVPPEQLVEVADYVPLLVAGPQKHPPGDRFSYSNSGYVLLGLAIEAAAGTPYREVVARRVLAPAAMADSGFFRFDALPEQVARGYVDGPDGWTTNAGKLPIIGGPDGGAFATVADIERLWRQLFAGAIISSDLAARFLAPAARYRDDLFYGRGVWLRCRGGRTEMIHLEGSDAGVSFKSTCYAPATIATVMSNTSEGAWPIAALIDELIAENLATGRRGFPGASL